MLFRSGCEEILEKQDKDFDYICTCVGTGGTIAGIVNSSSENQKVLGFLALNTNYLEKHIADFTNHKTNWQLINDYHFGGYGKVTDELIIFMNDFYDKYKILLDPIYTAKMLFGVFDLISKNYFPKNSKILMIHSGGIQGIHGINNLRSKKNQILIKTNE